VVQFNPGKLQGGGGSGLGLYISNGIMKLHNGTIAAWSAGEGQGSTFSIELPAYERQDENEGLHRGSSSSFSMLAASHRRSGLPLMQSGRFSFTQVHPMSPDLAPDMQTNVGVPSGAGQGKSLAVPRTV